MLATLSVLADVCDVYFNDGDMEAAVPDSRIHHSGGRGGSVEVDWQGHGDLYPATVKYCRKKAPPADLKCRVAYEDGDFESGASLSHIMRVSKKSPEKEPGAFTWIDWKGRGSYYKGQICGCVSKSSTHEGEEGLAMFDERNSNRSADVEVMSQSEREVLGLDSDDEEETEGSYAQLERTQAALQQQQQQQQQQPMLQQQEQQTQQTQQQQTQTQSLFGASPVSEDANWREHSYSSLQLLARDMGGSDMYGGGNGRGGNGGGNSNNNNNSGGSDDDDDSDYTGGRDDGWRVTDGAASCDVQYDDGDDEKGVPEGRICGEVREGQKAMVNWQGKGDWYKGTLQNCGATSGGGGGGRGDDDHNDQESGSDREGGGGSYSRGGTIVDSKKTGWRDWDKGDDSGASLSASSRLGTAVNKKLFQDRGYEEVVKKHFGSITAENSCKMSNTVKGGNWRSAKFHGGDCEKMYRWARQHGKWFRHHAICWHNQANNGYIGSCNNDRACLKRYIDAVVPTYRDAHAIDVVNECLVDGGGGTKHGLRSNDNPWMKTFRNDETWIDDALRWTRKHTRARLVVNDYSVSTGKGTKCDNGDKRGRLWKLAKRLKERNAPLDAVGFQVHWKLDSVLGWGIGNALQALDDSINCFKGIGLKVQLTEVDVRATPGPGPDDECNTKNGWVYAGIRAVCLANSNCETMTTWGFRDDETWLNYWFGKNWKKRHMFFEPSNREKQGVKLMRKVALGGASWGKKPWKGWRAAGRAATSTAAGRSGVSRQYHELLALLPPLDNQTMWGEGGRSEERDESPPADMELPPLYSGNLTDDALAAW